MKKKVVILLLGAMLSVAGCSDTAAPADMPDSSEASTIEPQTTEVSEEPVATDAMPSEKEPAKASETAGHFSNKYMDITIPEDLVDIAEVEVTDDCISIYHKESKDAGFGGFAFCIWTVPLASEYAGGPYIKLGELSDENADIYDVVRGEPTEIQWDYNLDDIPEDFKKLMDAQETILKSITGINDYNYIEGAGTKGEDLYNAVLAKYAKAIKEEWDADKLESENMSPEIYHVAVATEGKTLDYIGYAYQDINCDGIDELFIGEIAEEDFKGVVYDIYTVIDGYPAHVVSGSARDRYFDYENDFIVNEWASGAGEYGYDVYALMNNSTEMVYQFGYKYDLYENETQPWFKTYDMKEYENITEADFNDAYDLEKKYVRFDYAPLSGNKDALSLAEYKSQH